MCPVGRSRTREKPTSTCCPCRAGCDDPAARRVLTELLLLLTSNAARKGAPVYVFACTNRPHDCDPALLRRWVVAWVAQRSGGCPTPPLPPPHPPPPHPPTPSPDTRA